MTLTRVLKFEPSWLQSVADRVDESLISMKQFVYGQLDRAKSTFDHEERSGVTIIQSSQEHIVEDKQLNQSLDSVDPYYDFEHQVGDGYDPEALRPWPIRIYSSSKQKLEARITLSYSHQLVVEGGEALLNAMRDKGFGAGRPLDRDQSLKPEDYVFLHKGGSADEISNYEKISSDTIALKNPYTVININLTSLQPGRYTVAIDILSGSVRQIGRYLRFMIHRRPIYTFQHPAESIPTLVPYTVPAEHGEIKTFELFSKGIAALIKVPELLSWLEVLAPAKLLGGSEGPGKELAERVVGKLVEDYIPTKPDSFLGLVKDLLKDIPGRSHEEFEWGREVLLFHKWNVYESRWPLDVEMTNYTDVTRYYVLCITVLTNADKPKAKRTRWLAYSVPIVNPAEKWRRFGFTSWYAPHEHQLSPNPRTGFASLWFGRDPESAMKTWGFGLPFPTLGGLPDGQPDAFGGYERHGDGSVPGGEIRPLSR